MPEFKKVALSSVIISAALGVSSCSSVSMFDGSPISDNMKYRSNDASIKSLSIPPELSKPAFDNSYALNKPADPAPAVQQSSNTGNVMNRGPSTQDLLNSQSAPVQSGAPSPAPAPVVQARSAPAPVAPVRSAPPAATTTAAPDSARIQVALTKVKSGEPALAVNAPASNTWARLNSMLPKIGFDITKQQPAQGIYTVVYRGDPLKKRGLISSLLDSVDGVSLKSDKEAQAGSPIKTGETYVVILVGNASQQSFVGVRNSAGKAVNPAVSNHILGLLKGQYEL